VCRDTLCRTCVFASGGLCGSHSAFRCVRATKCRCTICHDGVGPVWIPQQACRDTLHRTCVFQSSGITGHVVHSCVFGAQKVDALFFVLRWAQCSFYKKRVGTSCAALVFFHAVGSASHVAHSVRPRCETSMNYFSFSCGPVRFP
jgi:hypothetical protein